MILYPLNLASYKFIERMVHRNLSLQNFAYFKVMDRPKRRGKVTSGHKRMLKLVNFANAEWIDEDSDPEPVHDGIFEFQRLENIENNAVKKERVVMKHKIPACFYYA